MGISAKLDVFTASFRLPSGTVTCASLLLVKHNFSSYRLFQIHSAMRRNKAAHTQGKENQEGFGRVIAFLPFARILFCIRGPASGGGSSIR